VRRIPKLPGLDACRIRIFVRSVPWEQKLEIFDQGHHRSAETYLSELHGRFAERLDISEELEQVSDGKTDRRQKCIAYSH